VTQHGAAQIGAIEACGKSHHILEIAPAQVAVPSSPLEFGTQLRADRFAQIKSPAFRPEEFLLLEITRRACALEIRRERDRAAPAAVDRPGRRHP